MRQAEAEHEVEPDGMAVDLAWEPMAVGGGQVAASCRQSRPSTGMLSDLVASAMPMWGVARLRVIDSARRHDTQGPRPPWIGVRVQGEDRLTESAALHDLYELCSRRGARVVTAPVCAMAAARELTKARAACSSDPVTINRAQPNASHIRAE